MPLVIDLGRQIVLPQRDAEQELNSGHARRSIQRGSIQLIINWGTFTQYARSVMLPR